MTLSRLLAPVALSFTLLAVSAGDNVLRLLPPLNVTDAEISEAAARLSRALRRASKNNPDG